MYRLPVIVAVAALMAGCAGQTNDFFASSAFWNRTGEAPADQRDELKPLFDQPYIDPLTEYLQRHEDDPGQSSQVAAVKQERDRRCAAVARRYNTDTITADGLALYRRGYSFSCPDDVMAYAEKLKTINHEASKKAEKTLAGAAQSETNTSETIATEDEVSTPESGKETAEASVKSTRKRDTKPSITAQSASSESTPAQSTSAQNTPAQSTPVQNNVASQQLNDCYLLTRIRNFSAALDACIEPAKNGIVGAQANMAQILSALGKDKEAYRWARRAAPESGAAANLLGEMYAQGRGVAQDDAAAAKWFRSAAEQGNTQAEASLANFVSGNAGANAN